MIEFILFGRIIKVAFKVTLYRTTRKIFVFRHVTTKMAGKDTTIGICWKECFVCPCYCCCYSDCDSFVYFRKFRVFIPVVICVVLVSECEQMHWFSWICRILSLLIVWTHPTPFFCRWRQLISCRVVPYSVNCSLNV